MNIPNICTHEAGIGKLRDITSPSWELRRHAPRCGRCDNPNLLYLNTAKLILKESNQCFYVFISVVTILETFHHLFRTDIFINFHLLLFFFFFFGKWFEEYFSRNIELILPVSPFFHCLSFKFGTHPDPKRLLLSAVIFWSRVLLSVFVSEVKPFTGINQKQLMLSYTLSHIYLMDFYVELPTKHYFSVYFALYCDQII